MTNSGIWQQPGTRVLVLGNNEDVNIILNHDGLRNTRHALYVTTEAQSRHIKHTIKKGILYYM